MRKLFCLIAILLVTLVGCSSSEKNEGGNKVVAQVRQHKDWFQLKAEVPAAKNPWTCPCQWAVCEHRKFYFANFWGSVFEQKDRDLALDLAKKIVIEEPKGMTTIQSGLYLYYLAVSNPAFINRYLSVYKQEVEVTDDMQAKAIKLQIIINGQPPYEFLK